jgi:hypothetical protein
MPRRLAGFRTRRGVRRFPPCCQGDNPPNVSVRIAMCGRTRSSNPCSVVIAPPAARRNKVYLFGPRPHARLQRRMALPERAGRGRFAGAGKLPDNARGVVAPGGVPVSWATRGGERRLGGPRTFAVGMAANSAHRRPSVRRASRFWRRCLSLRGCTMTNSHARARSRHASSMSVRGDPRRGVVYI